MITELDIGVLPNPWDLDGADVARRAEMQKGMNPYEAGLPDSVQALLAERYRDVFGLFLKYREPITRVTFWGLHDGHSWLNGWPIRGRTNYPLLFDRQGRPKPAFDAVIRAAAAAERGR
jgi:endo-1,4-beta-xylanase